jgi:uncharacterized membrane protein YtjA (UPF0391 family)
VLGWSLIFLIIAIIAAMLGFAKIEMISADIAWILFVSSLILFAVFLGFRLFRRRGPRS